MLNNHGIARLYMLRVDVNFTPAKPYRILMRWMRGAGTDALVTYNLWKQLGMPAIIRLHDLRWGEHFKGDGVDDFGVGIR